MVWSPWSLSSSFTLSPWEAGVLGRPEKAPTTFLYLCLAPGVAFLSPIAPRLLCKVKLFCELSQTFICPWQYLQSFAVNLQTDSVSKCQFLSLVSFPQSTAVGKESGITKALLSLKLGFNFQRLIIYYSVLCSSTFGDNISFLMLEAWFL